MWVEGEDEHFHGQLSKCCLRKANKQYGSYCVLLVLYAKIS